ncbi:hypothetical protein XANCAGTX0491_007890 [Xanthoria calcicola]
MASITIPERLTTDLRGQTAIVTGGAAGIGFAATRILSSLGARVHIFDILPLDEADADSNPDLVFHQCDVTSWIELRSAFESVGPVDLVFANAGISERTNYFTDAFDEEGKLREPSSTLMDTNLQSVLYTIKLAWFTMKQQKSKGSIVITTSATAYVPWQSLAVYTAAKLAASIFFGDTIDSSSDLSGRLSLWE